MSDQFSNFPMPGAPMSGPAQPPSLFGTWIKAVTRPNRQTYTEIAAQPNASTTTAVLWVFLTALVEFFFSILVGAIGGAAQQQMIQQFTGGQQLPLPSAGSRIFEVLCGAPVAAVLMTLWFLLTVGVVHLVARAFGGKATFDHLAFVFASIFAPVALVSTVIALLEAIPFLGIAVAFCFLPLSLLLIVYVVVIEVVATSAIHQIGGGSAAVSVLALPVFVGLCGACAVIAGLMALGPTIGNIFSSINSSLQTAP